MSINFNVNNNKKSAKDIFVGVNGAKRRIIKVLTSISGTKRTIYEYGGGGILGTFKINFYKNKGSSASGGSASYDIPFFKYIKSMHITGEVNDTAQTTFYFKLANGTVISKNLRLYKMTTITDPGVIDKNLTFTWGADSLTITVTDGANNTVGDLDMSVELTASDITDVNNLKSMYISHIPNRSSIANYAYHTFDVVYDF